MRNTSFRLLLTGTMLLGLPLIGVSLTGESLSLFLEFPPLTQYVTKPSFSWPLFLIAASINLILIGGILILFFSYNRSEALHFNYKKTQFPKWGWFGIVIVAIGWFLAWTRMDWFSAFQRHTFTLPWIGYILVVNGLCFKRTSTCIMLENPKKFLLLFLYSALFWWFFEYLNRFVQNWYYVGIEDFSPAAYVIFASLSFSTVLPAVLSTNQYLHTFPALTSRLSRGFSFNISISKRFVIVTLILSSLTLSIIGIFPNQMFPIIWISPLLVFSSLQVLTGQPTIFAGIKTGDWRYIVLPALSALICGVFWEMWNIGSLAKWHYNIPYVHRFLIFEMPILGYGGYLPFGLECLVFGRVVLGES